MLRAVLGVVIGVVAAFVVTFGVELVWQQLAPMPPGLRPDDPAAIAAFLRTAPISAFIAVLVGWTVAAFAGAWIAAAIGRRGAWPGWIVTGLYLAATCANFAMISHPVWFMAVAVLLILAAGYLGARLGSRRRQAMI
jgi:hypothetical protein